MQCLANLIQPNLRVLRNQSKDFISLFLCGNYIYHTHLRKKNDARVMEVTGLGIIWGLSKGRMENRDAGNTKGGSGPIQNKSKAWERPFRCF